MQRMPVPVDFWRASVSFWLMAAEAQVVVGLRLLGLAGFWSLGPGEGMRMWAEKAHAAQDAGHAAARALWRGAGPGRVALAAVRPVRRRTRANVRRLTRRGPGGPR